MSSTAMPSIDEVMNLYLYGTSQRPANLVDQNLIRSAHPEVRRSVDISAFMAGPGRFAVPAMFELIQKFMNGYGDLPPGGYGKHTIAANLGWTNDHYIGLNLDQAFYDDGGSDYLDRAFIWHNTRFKISDSSLFVIDPDGTRHIVGLSIEPIIDADSPENFDFTSAGLVGNLVNGFSETWFDPSRLGRTVVFDFVGEAGVISDYKQSDYSFDLGHLITADPALASRITELGPLSDRLFNAGVTRFLDEQNRPIIYGTNGVDDIDLRVTPVSGFNTSIYDHRHFGDFAQNGVVGIGGNGNDRITGTYSDDKLIGGAGADALSGGDGVDTYVLDPAGSAAGTLIFDTIDDSDGQGHISIGNVMLGQATWVKDNVWEDASGLYMLVKVGDSLYITTKSETKANIIGRIMHWPAGDTALGITLQSKPQTPAVAIDYNGSGDSDYYEPFTVTSNPSYRAIGNAGNDMMLGSTGADDILEGGDGNDILSGEFGEDALFGDAGDDFICGMGEDSTAHGGDGNDVITANDLAGLRIVPSNTSLVDADTIWKDLSRYFTWRVADQQNPFKALDGNGEIIVDIEFDQLDADWNFSGVSANGRPYRFYSTPNGPHGFELEYLSNDGYYVSVLSLGIVSPGSRTYYTYDRGVSLFGDAGNDIINGGDAADYLDGGEDDDLMAGLAGDDTMAGGGGRDTLYGGSGDDLISGGSGNDELHGNTGADILDGNDGNDVISGDDVNDGLSGGNDSIDGGAGNDTLVGVVGDDMIFGGDGDDSIHGDADNIDESLHGNDSLYAGAGNDFVNGGAGNDFIDGGDGNDSLLGGKGDDFLRGGAGDDALNGGAGNDVYQFESGWGQDAVFGLTDSAAGTDVIAFGAGVDPAAVQIGVNLSGGLVLIETATGSSLTLDGVLNGGPNHRIEFSDGTTWQLSELRQRYAAIVNGQGTAGNDVIVGDTASNAIDGGIGDDTIYAGSGDDVLMGGMGDDYSGMASDNDHLFGGDGNDTIDGQRGDDTLVGGNGNDVLRGGEGSDALYGEAGDDTLDAGHEVFTNGILIQDDASDLLDGGTGNDLLRGGLGRNIYAFDPGFGHDRLQLTEALSYAQLSGMSSEVAVLQFRAGISANAVNIAFVGDDLVITAGGDSLTIVDYNLRNGASVEFQFDDGSVLSPAQSSLLTTRQGTAQGETLTGSSLNDSLFALGGEDTLRGGAGNDVLVGGAGTDTLYGGAGDDTFRYGIGDGRDYIFGGASDLAGIDTLELGDGINLGDVTLYRDDSHLYVVVNATGNYIKSNWTAGATDIGIDLIRFADGSTLTAAQIQAMSLPPPPQLDFYATSAGGTFTGNALSNDLTAVQGSVGQTFAGGKGDDRYILNEGTAYQSIVENAGEGTDTVLTSFNYFVLPDNVENLIARPGTWIYPDPRTYIGNALNNVIDVSGGDVYSSGYRLDGGAGADLLIGGASNDTYVVDSAQDQIIESARNTSVDTVEASISYSIAGRSELENVTLTGNGATSATGNQLANRLDGSLSSGANTLTGGLGDDTYVVGSGDVVVEAAGEGTDTVVFSTGVIGAYTTTAHANVERFVLGQNTYSSSLTGGGGNDDLTGNTSDNVLTGGAGNDVLRDRDVWTNYDDTDQLYGGDGNDTLISLRGNDLLVGGKGNDTLQGNTATFAYSLGDGQDTIVGTGSAGTATLRFDSTIAPSDLHLSRTGDDLIIDIGTGTSDRIVIQGYWSGETITSPVKYINFLNADGSTRESWQTAGVIGRLYAVTLTGGAGDDNLVGGVGYDTLVGNGGNDRLEGGAGDDTLDGGLGNDTYVFDGNFGMDRVLAMDATGNGADTIQFGATYNTGNLSWSVNENDDLVLSGVNNGVLNEVTLVGFMRNGAPAHQVRLSDGTVWTSASIRAQVLAATAGADYIYGFGSDDTIDALGGDDYVYGRGGNDTLRGGDGIDYLEGGDGNDHLYGDAGDDSLVGGAGSDILEGGLGNDTYYVEDGLDTVIEAASAGTDTVHAFADYTLAANVENLVLRDNALRGTGNALNNRIEGTDLNNVLDGGAGNDTLLGGAGDDLYIVDSTSDVVTEAAGNGTDTIQTTVTLTTLAANVENLILAGGSAINGTGNALANVITGNGANNTLNGGGGIDTLIGGAGDDTYVVDVTGDVVNELAGEGTDTVQAGASYTLSANVENLTLTGTGAFAGTGNALNNTLTGNNGNNTLTGGAGNDTLNGGGGIDTLIGGTGDDIYDVDTTTDVITELAGEGTDLIRSTVTFDMSSRANIENLTLGGSSAINGTGNSLDNVITGNSANNTLNGGAGNDTLDGGLGNDTMIGGAGDDIYYVNVATDVVTEASGGGTDTVNSAVTFDLSLTANQNIENVTLTGTSAINATGNALANTLIGNGANNTISAGAGNDTLEGGAGTDSLTGGTGNDTYRMARGYGVDTAIENDATAGNYDIVKFLSGVAYDQLWFSRPSGSNNLEITIIGTSDKLVVKDWYLGTQYRTEEIQTVDGNRYLLAADVQTLVTAMAGLTPPALGQTTLSASQRTALNTALGAWKTYPSLVTSSLPADLQPGGRTQIRTPDGGLYDSGNGPGRNDGSGVVSTTTVAVDEGDALDLVHAWRGDRAFGRHGALPGDGGRGGLLGWARNRLGQRRQMMPGSGGAVPGSEGPGCNLPGQDQPRDLHWLQPDGSDWLRPGEHRPIAPTCDKTPLSTTSILRPGANAPVLSNCNRLIDLMAMTEGQGSDVGYVPRQEPDMPHRWIP